MSSLIRENRWRTQIVDGLSRLFQGEDSALYGPTHALRVEEGALGLVATPEYRAIHNLDITALRCAGLLHDVGFAERDESWAVDQIEHVKAGVGLASQIVAENEAFQGHPERIERVLYLIAHHEDTTRRFPTATRGGMPLPTSSAGAIRPDDPLLPILREADSLVHAGDDCIEESVHEWLGQGIPALATHGVAIATWMWMTSVVGNIRLTAKRAILDAHTAGGTLGAIEAYDRLEKLVRKQCDLAGVGYEAEVCHPSMRQSSVERMAGKSFQLRIVRFYTWDALEQILRSVPLRGDRSVHPYRYATIRGQLVNIDSLSPLSLYVLEGRLDKTLELHDAFMVTYSLNLWALPGLIEFTYNSPEVQKLAPPLVERYVETSYPVHTVVYGLVDGLHRCHVARSLGLPRMRVLVASDVPHPLVALPATWSEVRVCQEPPHPKRRYRFQSLDDFARAWFQTSVEVDENNFQYFLFRDLRALGSRGRRSFDEFEDRRAH